MSEPAPRLRMFAGPNGSGKSTIKDHLPLAWLGIYVNADDIERTARAAGSLPLAPYGVTPTPGELQAFLSRSSLLHQQGLAGQAHQLTLESDRVVFGTVEISSYWASVLADFLRHKLLAARMSFTFETVMSSRDKVEFLKKAQSTGFRTYLYFVATEDPEINISRVAHRVRMGGHPVPTDKIVTRYHRSLGLLNDAVLYADRAYLFDNSGDQRVWVAEVTGGSQMEMKTDRMPHWFKHALWDPFVGDAPVAG